MNKAIQFLIMMVMIDTFFAINNIGGSTVGLVADLLQPEGLQNLDTSSMFLNGINGLGWLIGGGVAAVLAGAAILGRLDATVAAAMGISLLFSIPDLLIMYNVIAKVSPDLATIIMVPIMAIFTFVTFEWVRTPLA